MSLKRRFLDSRTFRYFRTLTFIVGVAYFCVTLTPLVRWITEAIDQDWFGGNGEVLVVLAGSMLVPGTGPQATLGYDTYLRCTYASWILQQQAFRIVVVTGNQGAAISMQRFLIARGIPAQVILVEDRAGSTYENALYTKQVLLGRYRALPEVVVLTSDFHSWRARHVFQHVGFRTQMIAVPDVIKRSSSITERWPLFLIELGELTKDVVYLAERRL